MICMNLTTNSEFESNILLPLRNRTLIFGLGGPEDSVESRVATFKATVWGMDAVAPGLG